MAELIVRDANGQALSHVMRRSPAGVPLRDYSRARKRGASPSTSPSCWTCCGGSRDAVAAAHLTTVRAMSA